MTLEMRELRGDDLFTMLNIVTKLGIKDEFVKLFDGAVADAKANAENEDADNSINESVMGVKVVAALLQVVLGNLSVVKHELNSLLADLTGQTEQQIADLPFSDYTGLIMAFFKKPELTDFFHSIASFLA
ncbi:hypothetical protein [Weissella cibaria]|uniref:hypothetical protein n=1 Tax=Weissella cibaria TaxID=137591 RepID=UPI00215A7481|nr:hypothetical protein [Weissella cibaria]MCR8704184.1 hypothetical protein [Weissella cibaria]